MGTGLSSISTASVGLAVAFASMPAAAQAPTQRIAVIHTVNAKPDESRGVVKLAKYRSRQVAQAGDVTVVSVNYEELCTMPCGIPVDLTERPMFFFIRDGSPVSRPFRIPDGADEFTVKMKPVKKGMRTAGVLLTALIFTFPVGVPLWIASSPRMWIAKGAPDDGGEFRKLKRART